MKRAILNFLLDMLAFVAFVLLMTTGFVMRFVLPPGSGRLGAHGLGKGAEGGSVSLLWGMSRHQWGVVHFWISIGLLIVLAFHIVLHWRWIVCMVRGRPREGSGVRVALGLLGLTALILLAVAPFLSPKVEVSRQRLQPDAATATSNGEEAETIRGSMTLHELAQATGVPTSHFLQQLALPQDAPLEERLGRLRRQYGFEMRDVRDIVRNY